MKNLKRIILIPFLLICILMQTILLRFYTLNGKQSTQVYQAINKLAISVEALRKEENIEEIIAFDGSKFFPTDIFLQTSDGKTISASLNTSTGKITYRYVSPTTNKWTEYPASTEIDVKKIIQDVAKNGGDSKDKTKVVYYGTENGKKIYAYGIDNYATIGELLLSGNNLKETSSKDEFNRKFPEGYNITTTIEGLQDIDWKSPETIQPIEASAEELDTNGFLSFIDGFVGLLLYPMKLGPALLAIVGHLINAGITHSNAGGAPILATIFYQVQDSSIFSTNFIDANGGLGSKDVNGNSTGKVDETWDTIRTNIAIWYVSLRNLSIIILVVIAMYVGIRLAIETVAAEQAKYKRHLINWVQSLCLVVVMHYIMVLVNSINDSLVKLIAAAGGITKETSPEGVPTLGQWLGMVANISFIESTAACFAFVGFEIITLMFVIQYLKRMVTIAFLTVIAPLVTITYSIDKMRDGKAQAFDNWLKEYCYTILIQPFHGILFLVIGSIGIGLIKAGDNFDVGNALIGLYMLAFIIQGENILKQIFGVRPSHLGETVSNIGMVTALTGAAGKVGAGVVNTGKFIGGSVSHLRKSHKLPASTSSEKISEGSVDGEKPKVSQGGGTPTQKANGAATPSATGDGSGQTKKNIRGVLTPTSTDGRGKRVLKGIGRTGLKALNFYGRGAVRMTALSLGIGTAIATGKPEENLITQLSNANQLADPINASLKGRQATRDLDRWMDQYADTDGKNMTPDEIRSRGLDLYHGRIEAKTKNDENLRRAIEKEADRLRKNGVAADKIDETLEKRMVQVQQRHFQNMTDNATIQAQQTSAAQEHQTNPPAAPDTRDYSTKVIEDVLDKEGQKIENLISDLEKQITDGLRYKGADTKMVDYFERFGSMDDREREEALRYIGAHMSSINPDTDFEMKGGDKDLRKALESVRQLKDRASKYETHATEATDNNGGGMRRADARVAFGSIMVNPDIERNSHTKKPSDSPTEPTPEVPIEEDPVENPHNAQSDGDIPPK